MEHLTGKRGVTLIELLLTLVISSIAFLALVVPFVAERSFWGAGRAQTEAQRDAQMALRAIARVARGSGSYAIDADARGITFYEDPAKTVCRAYFDGDPSVGAGFLDMVDRCGAGPTATLIDGNPAQSRVTDLLITEVVPDRLVNIQLGVTHNDREDEFLETELFLRNAS